MPNKFQIKDYKTNVMIMNIIHFAQKYLFFIYGSCIWKHFK